MRPLLCVLFFLFAPGLAQAGVDPVMVVETAKRLGAVSLDSGRAFVADGQVLARDGVTASFDEGLFHAVAREDGRVVGLLFDGVGNVEFHIPAGIETTSWQQGTNFSPMSQPIGGAFLRFSDATLDDLQGEREWQEAKDPTGALFRTYEARAGLNEDPLWLRWAPHLVTDQLMDLYGGGHVGGHVLAEFRLVGDGRADWVSYLSNPRGALLPGETDAIYTARKVGDAPPELHVLASWGTHPEASRSFDVSSIALDVTFPTSGRGNRNMVDAVIAADLELVALRQDLPLQAVVLELAEERLLCTGQSDRDRIKVKRVTDADGNSLAAIHSRNRLFIPLARAVAPGQQTKLHIEYEGPMTQGIPVNGSPDVYFSPLGPWAWYPRPIHMDRFASRVEAHLPRFMRAVAPGDLTDERKEKDGWHFVFEEPSGVRTISLVVGDMVVNDVSDQGSNPRIMVWYGQGMEKEVRIATPPLRQMVDFASSVWGGYPYTTLHVIENVPYPATNWRMVGDNLSGSWSCVPPGDTHPWQGFVEGASTMVMATSPTTTPARDLPQSRVLDRMFVDPVGADSYIRFVDITRQWWGHLVPPATPRDTWIPEAFAAWTGLLFTRTAVGEGAMKERLQTMHLAMVDNHELSEPLVVGERLGRSFAPQVWGRGPLVISWMVDRMGAQVFMTAMKTLVNRGAAQGIDEALLLEIVSLMSDSGAAEQLQWNIEHNELAAVQYTPTIDKVTGEVVIVFQQDPEEFIPVDLTVEAVISPKEKLTRTAHLTEPTTVMRWTPDKTPKRVKIDPLGSSLSRSLKKVGGLVPPPEDAPPPKDESDPDTGSEEAQ